MLGGKESLMKFKTVVLGCLMGAIALLFVHQFSFAQTTAPATVSNIGLISVSRALRDCKATATFGAQAQAEAEEMAEKEKALNDEINMLKGAVRALVPGTPDYMEQLRQLMLKQGELQAIQEYRRELRSASQRAWAEKVYKEILRLTQEVAARNNLDLVLERSEPEFPIKNADQLMMTLSTNKVLYGDGCTDITDEVIAELDKIESTLVK
jgi:Skp family chaperone for outer membrane proteins